jgi:hypothetical protein
MTSFSVPRSPLEAMMQLHPEVRDWWQTRISVAQMKAGIAPDPAGYWQSLPESEQWKIVAELLEQTVNFDFNKPPKAKTVREPKMIQPQVKTITVPSAPTIATAPLTSTVSARTNESDKVKEILLTWSKVRFIGNEGSGKTSKARWLCHQRIALGHEVYWINPHLNADDKAKLEALNVVIIGGGRDYAAIARFCCEMVVNEDSELNQAYERYGSVAGAKFPPRTFVFDELTNYKDQEVLKSPIQTVMKASMQEFSKINWNSIYVTHNDTLSCMAMPEGTRNLVDSSVFDLRLEADIQKGNRVPKSIAQYRMPNSDDWHDVKIPVDWQ